MFFFFWSLALAADLRPLWPEWNDWVAVPTLPANQPGMVMDELAAEFYATRQLDPSKCGSLCFKTAEPNPILAHLKSLQEEFIELAEMDSLNNVHVGELIRKKIARHTENFDELWHVATTASTLAHTLSEMDILVPISHSLQSLSEILQGMIKADGLFCSQANQSELLPSLGWALHLGLISIFDLIPLLQEKISGDPNIVLFLVDVAARIRNPQLEAPSLPAVEQGVEGVLRAALVPMLQALKFPHDLTISKLLVSNIFDTFAAWFGTHLFKHKQVLSLAALIKDRPRPFNSIIFYKEEESEFQRFKLVVRSQGFDLFMRLSEPFKQVDGGFIYVGKVSGHSKPSDLWVLSTANLIKYASHLGITTLPPIYRERLPHAAKSVVLVASRLNEYHREDRDKHVDSDVFWLEFALLYLREKKLFGELLDLYN